MNKIIVSKIISKKLLDSIKHRLDKQIKILIKNSSWVFIANIIKTGLIFVRSVFVARGLGVELYGTYITILAFVVSIQSFFNLNLGTALIKFGSEYIVEGKEDILIALVKFFYLIAIIAISISIIIVSLVTHFFYGTIVKRQGLEFYIIILAIANGFVFFDYLSQSFLRLFYKFKLNSLINIIMSFIDVGIVIIAINIFYNNFANFIIMVSFGKLLSSLVCNIFAFWELREIIQKHSKVKINLIKYKIRNIFNFILNNYGSRLIKVLMEQGDVLLLNSISNSVQVGYYGISKRLGYAILTITDPLANAVYPQLSKLISEKKYKDLYKLIIQLFKITIIPALIILIVVFFLKEKIIVILYGNDFIAAKNIFYLILIATVISASTFWNISLLLSLNEVNYRLKVNIINLIIGFILSLLLLPKYGAFGMAIVLLIIKLLEMIFGVSKSLRIILINVTT